MVEWHIWFLFLFFFFLNFLLPSPHPCLFFFGNLHISRALQLCTLQYILQTRQVLLTSSSLAVLCTSLSRAIEFRKSGLFFLSATNLSNKPGKALSLSVAGFKYYQHNSSGDIDAEIKRKQCTMTGNLSSWSITFLASAWSWLAFCSVPLSSGTLRGEWATCWSQKAGAGCGRCTGAGELPTGMAGQCDGAGSKAAGSSSAWNRMRERGLAPLKACKSWLSLEVVEATV